MTASTRWRTRSPATSASSSKARSRRATRRCWRCRAAKTPLPIYAKLAEAKLPWKRVTIIPGDERLVPMTGRAVERPRHRPGFLPSGARVVPITGDIADYKLAGNSADARLQDLHWPPDLVWLGMGSDGHTASIFRGPDMDDALNAPKARRAVGVMPDPLPKEAPVPRVTLTRSAILSARTILITIRGQEKRAAGAGDRGRPFVEAADRPRAGRSRAADRHPLVPLTRPNSPLRMDGGRSALPQRRTNPRGQ